ncbi:MAG: HD domain-containing protein [Gammaproteobacteria bacterium]|nr:HD domain-containing protein [Gammaproteobacteria bacterium]
MRILLAYRLRLLLFGGMAGLMLLTLGAVLYSYRALHLGQRDTEMLEQVRNIEALAGELSRHGNHYLMNAPRDYPEYERDRQMYYVTLSQQVVDISTELGELTAYLRQQQNRPWPQLTITEDKGLEGEIDRLGRFWNSYRDELQAKLGDPGEPRLEWGAQYIVAQQAQLQRLVTQATDGAAQVINRHLLEVRQVGQWGILTLAGLGALGISLLYRMFFTRLALTIQGCRQIALGHFGYHIPDGHGDELSALDGAVNELSTRVATVFSLFDKIQQGADLRATTVFVQEALREFLPVDWLALYEIDENCGDALLREMLPTNEAMEGMGAVVPLTDEWLCEAMTRRQPLLYNVMPTATDPLARVLNTQDLHSVILLPLPLDQGGFLLVIASRQADGFLGEQVELLKNLSVVIAHGFEKSALTERMLLATINGLSKLAESRDPETGDHLVRMSLYSAAIAGEMIRSRLAAGEVIPSGFVRDLLRFAPMHDIGKVGIPDSILLKPGKLSDEERQEMNLHPIIGGEVLRTCALQLPERARKVFRIAIEIAEGHHERFDGTGYPHGLKGSEIPLSARIIAVADVFDALTSKRPYKEAWPLPQAIDAIKAQSDRHFDPAVVAALMRNLPEIRRIYDKHKHI